MVGEESEAGRDDRQAGTPGSDAQEDALNFKNVVFCNNNPGHITSALWETFTELIVKDMQGPQHLGGCCVLESGGLLSIYRNKLIERALTETDCEWVWIVDSDIILRWDTLNRLLEYADPDTVPILGALYYMRLDDGMYPSILGRKKHPDGTVKVAPLMRYDEPWPHDQLLAVDAVGMGCTLIHRTVFDKMKAEYGTPEPWFAQDHDGPVVCGEDVSFCLRAKKMGFQPHLHTGIEVGHLKSLPIDSASLGVTHA